MTTSLVLEGGGLRGAYTAGVLAWFLDNQIKIDYIVGISSGAQYLCNYLIGDAKELKEVSVKWAGAYFEKGLKPLLREGNLVGYDKLFDEVLLKIAPLDLAVLKAAKIKGEFAVYDLAAGTTTWIKAQDLDPELRLLKAACTLPGFSKAVDYQGAKLIDGGVTTMIPIDQSLKNGIDKHIVISTKTNDYVRKPISKMTRLILWVFYHKYPKLRADLKLRAPRYYQEKAQVDALVNQGLALKINPSYDTGISRFGGDLEKLEELFNLGYQDAEHLRKEIKEFVEK